MDVPDVNYQVKKSPGKKGESGRQAVESGLTLLTRESRLFPLPSWLPPTKEVRNQIHTLSASLAAMGFRNINESLLEEFWKLCSSIKRDSWN